MNTARIDCPNALTGADPCLMCVWRPGCESARAVVLPGSRVRIKREWAKWYYKGADKARRYWLRFRGVVESLKPDRLNGGWVATLSNGERIGADKLERTAK